VQGHNPISLDDEGFAQARRLRDKLAEVAFAEAYCSDLLRTRQVCETILSNGRVTHSESSDLRELDYGEWEGLNINEVKERYPEEFSGMLAGENDCAPPGGESVTQLLVRTGRFVEQVRNRATEGNVLVVCHGGSLRGLIVQLMGLPETTFWSFQVDLASVSMVNIHPRRTVLALLNDTSHLKDLS
jgi:broad specificity phosphatase PhoE